MKYLNIFFGIAAEPMAWLGLVYCLLAFPLGIFYFTFLLTGSLLGISLIIIWIGIPIILLVMGAWWGLAVFERFLAIGLLGVKISPMSRTASESSLWNRFLNHLKNPVTWKSFGFLFLKFPIGIMVFVITVTLLSIVASFIATPFFYRYSWLSFNGYFVNSLWFAIALAFAGILLGFASLHFFRFLGKILGMLAAVMLGDTKHEVTQDSSALPAQD